MEDGEHNQDGDCPQYREQYNLLRREENKENVARTIHPNRRSDYDSQGIWDYEESEDSLEEEIDPFVGSVLANGNRNTMLGGSIGFRVHAITEDGWMCCLEELAPSVCKKNCNALADEPCATQQTLVLLHLPTKVAALGRQGMFVSGMDLMKRRDNGVLEPHTRILSSNPLTRSTNHLFGRASLQ